MNKTKAIRVFEDEHIKLFETVDAPFEQALVIDQRVKVEPGFEGCIVVPLKHRIPHESLNQSQPQPRPQRVEGPSGDARKPFAESQRFRDWQPSNVAGILETHYTPQQVAEMWGVGVDMIRETFENEPGVLLLGDRNPKHKRRYITMRIPESVLARVYRRLTAKGVPHAKALAPAR